ncbi:MAG: hypothetical protein LBQ79_00070, partial [Deltaproteobacteria bacterium]|nr:hypothetical protein [Deltaproteobacteria bacterium]
IDPRPLGARAAACALNFLVFLPVGAAGTLALYAALPALGTLAWSGIFLALLWLALSLWLMKPRLALLSEANLRRPEEGEIPPGTEKYLALLSSGDVKVGPEDVLVSTAFYPGLPAPFPMAGRILVPEKALRAFPPKALEVRVAAAALCRVVSSGRSIALLRFFSMSLAVPAALILLNSAGILYGYPVVVRPPLVALVWAGIWAAFWFSEFAALYVERTVSARVSATVAAVTLDARSLFESVEITARGNLDPATQTPWLDFFRPRQNPVSQFEAIRRSIQEMVESATKRRAAAAAGSAGGKGAAEGVAKDADPGRAGTGGNGNGSSGSARPDGADAPDGPEEVSGSAAPSVSPEGPDGGRDGPDGREDADGDPDGPDGREGPGRNGYN